MLTRKLTVGVLALCALSLLLRPSRAAHAEGSGLSFAGLLAQAPAAGASVVRPLVGPDGEYSREAIMQENYWLVVDEDWQNGLNGRLSPKFPKNFDAMDALWPDTKDIGNWPVVARFPRLQVLYAVNGNRGLLFASDAQGKPYMLVRIEKDRFCFVRCHPCFVRPVRLTDELTNG